MHRMERHFSAGIRRHIYTQVQQFVQVSTRESIRKAVSKKKLQTKTYDVVSLLYIPGLMLSWLYLFNWLHIDHDSLWWLLPYMWKFSLDKNLTKPSYHCIAEIFGGINFRQCGKDHILFVIINTGQKIGMIKISPMRADGEINENFLLKQTVLTYWCKRVEKYLLFLKTLAISIHSSTFQGLSALKERSCTLSFRTHGMQQLERVVTLPGALSV